MRTYCTGDSDFGAARMPPQCTATAAAGPAPKRSQFRLAVHDARALRWDLEIVAPARIDARYHMRTKTDRAQHVEAHK